MTEENLKKYFLNNGKYFRITNINVIRDGGTIELNTVHKNENFYINKSNKSFHSEYPPNDINLITDSLTIEYLFTRIDSYIKNCKENIKMYKNLALELEKNLNNENNTL